MKLDEKIVRVLTQPRVFFRRIKKERFYQEPFTYYALLFLVMLLLTFLVQYFFLSRFFPFFKNLNFYTIYPLVYLLALPFTFVFAGLLHLWCLIFGGKGRYLDSYSLFVYSRTPSLLFGWIPGISFLADIYNLVLLIIGSQEIHKLNKIVSLVIFVVPYLLYWFLIILLIKFLGGFSFLLGGLS